MMQNAQFHQVVIIGGGFGGLYAAKALRRVPVRATLVDKRNFHLFQPLLYQVATGGLSPGDIAYPLPSVFAHDDNLAVIMAEVIDIDVPHRTVTPTCVIDIRDSTVTMCRGKAIESLQAHTILWTAGVKASVMGAVLAKHTGVTLDRAGRVQVEPVLTIPGYPEIFVIGDLVHCAHQDGTPLPGLAAVAMQHGRYVGGLISQRLREKDLRPFRYHHKENLAIIGRHAGVADFGRWHVHGFLAWILGLFVHIAYLIGFDNKLLVLFQWVWNYVTRKRGAQLITGKDG